jgi:hypothetical protein
MNKLMDAVCRSGESPLCHQSNLNGPKDTAGKSSNVISYLFAPRSSSLGTDLRIERHLLARSMSLLIYTLCITSFATHSRTQISKCILLLDIRVFCLFISWASRQRICIRFCLLHVKLRRTDFDGMIIITSAGAASVPLCCRLLVNRQAASVGRLSYDLSAITCMAVLGSWR